MTDNQFEQDKDRIEFIYDYTNSIIRENENSIKSSDIKLGFILILSSVNLVLINTMSFGQPLISSSLYVYFFLTGLKFLAAVLALATNIVAVCGILPKSRLGATPPEGLMKERGNGRDARELKIIVIKTWLDELETHDFVRDAKALCVKRAFVLWLLAYSTAVDAFYLTNLI